jgi:release factor glutamine methyltransferase
MSRSQATAVKDGPASSSSAADLATPDDDLDTTFDHLLNLASRQRGLPWREARMLLAFASGATQEWLVAHGNDPADLEVAHRFLELVARRESGEPMAYLTGTREFYGRPFAVTPAVLIPRPETELLVDVALELLKDVAQPRLLDLGTGSGILAVTLALERPDAAVVAADLSRQALDVASGNAAALGADRIVFREGDWWQALEGTDGLENNEGLSGPYDLIVSNPPYLATDDPHLALGDLRFEPSLALVAGSDGATSLDAVISNSAGRLARSGWLAVEHGLEQGALCRHLMKRSGFEAIETRRDLEHRERVTLGRREG